MNDAKYVGLDVHRATISAVFLDSTGHLMTESILETKAATILQFIHGLRGSLHVTLEEGTCAGQIGRSSNPKPRQWLRSWDSYRTTGVADRISPWSLRPRTCL
jgi:hypothetical protein